MKVASHLRMPLHTCIESMSHREYLTWLEYLNQQENSPSRSDYYAMQIALTLRHLFGKRRYSLDDFVIKAEEPVQTTVAGSKNKWFSFLGIKKDNHGQGN